MREQEIVGSMCTLTAAYSQVMHPVFEGAAGQVCGLRGPGLSGGLMCPSGAVRLLYCVEGS